MSKRERFWSNGILTRELLDGSEVTENIGKTIEELLGNSKIVERLRGRNLPVAAPKIQAMPLADWPLWAKAFKWAAKPEDKGIGDIVARMIGDENSMKFKQWHLATFGRPCDCTGRRERWNRQYPL
jgi:hypothetical protein